MASIVIREESLSLRVETVGITPPGGGDVDGPSASTNNAIARFDGVSGKALQDSLVTIDDDGNVSLPALAVLDGRDVSVDGVALDALQQLEDLEKFGDYSDGDFSPSSGTTTLLRDMYWDEVAPSGTAKIIFNGFAVRCRHLDLSNAPFECFVANGIPGVNAVGSSGAGGLATAGGIWGNVIGVGNTPGVSSGAGATQNGAAAVVGNSGPILGGIGGPGGAGGANDSAVIGGAGGAIIGVNTLFNLGFRNVEPVANVVPRNGGGGCGGRSGTGSGAGGGGGSTGGGAYRVPIFARTVTRGPFTSAGCIVAKGGVGGNGAAGTTVVGQGGGGGGGGGGAGGLIDLIYRFLLGAPVVDCLMTDGGAGGNGGNSGGSLAVGGTGGTGGGGGVVQLINISTAAVTRVVGGAGSPAVVASTQTGTTGGAGGVCSVTL